MRRVLLQLLTAGLLSTPLAGCPKPDPSPAAPGAPTPAERVDPARGERVEGPLDACARAVPGISVAFGDRLPAPAAAALLLRAAAEVAQRPPPPPAEPLGAEVVERYRRMVVEHDRAQPPGGGAPRELTGLTPAQVEALDELVGLLIVPRALWRASGARVIRGVAGEKPGVDLQEVEEQVVRLCTGALAREVYGPDAVEAMLQNEVTFVRIFVRRVVRGESQPR